MKQKSSVKGIHSNFLKSSTNTASLKTKNSTSSLTSKFRTEERFKWQNRDTYIVGNDELKGTLSKHKYTPNYMGWDTIIARTKDNNYKTQYSLQYLYINII